MVDRNKQNEKEGYGHISFKIGGSDFLGNEPDVDLESDNLWDYLSMTVGAYGYYGRNQVDFFPAIANYNYFYRSGLDVDLSYKRLRTRFSGVYGRDTNPFFTSAVHDDIKSLVMAAEAEYFIGSNVIAVFRYEYQDDGTAIHNRLIPAIAYAPLQNTRLVLEYKNDNIVHDAKPGTTNNIAQLGLSFSF